MNQIQNLGTNKIHFNLEVEVDKLVSEAENEKISMIVERVAETMKKEYGSAVAEFESKLTEAYDLIDKLSKRIEKLETAVNSGQAQQSSSQEYKTVSSFPTSGEITTLSEEQIQEILSYSDKYKKKGDWIYYTYPLNKDYAYLYRVRSNGTDNEKILPMKICAGISWDWDINADCIEFKDRNSNIRRMPIPPEPPKNAKPALSEREIKYILSYSSCYRREGDWIYSVDPDAGRYSYLYRCRSDGSENKKLLDFKIDTMYDWSVKNGQIKVKDQEGKVRKFTITN
ncbi:MAG: hypothetical protein IIT39_14340 [Clostridia bacterium]|nr:hypothetical protein [Clostridia bacterium]